MNTKDVDLNIMWKMFREFVLPVIVKASIALFIFYIVSELLDYFI